MHFKSQNNLFYEFAFRNLPQDRFLKKKKKNSPRSIPVTYIARKGKILRFKTFIVLISFNIFVPKRVNQKYSVDNVKKKAFSDKSSQLSSIVWVLQIGNVNIKNQKKNQGNNCTG